MRYGQPQKGCKAVIGLVVVSTNSRLVSIFTNLCESSQRVSAPPFTVATQQPICNSVQLWEHKPQWKIKEINTLAFGKSVTMCTHEAQLAGPDGKIAC